MIVDAFQISKFNFNKNERFFVLIWDIRKFNRLIYACPAIGANRTWLLTGEIIYRCCLATQCDNIVKRTLWAISYIKFKQSHWHKIIYVYILCSSYTCICSLCIYELCGVRIHIYIYTRVQDYIEPNKYR